MGVLVTPPYVGKLAALLDVKAAAEWALPFALASMPLPNGWTYLVANDGNVSFIHEARSQSPQQEHPLLDRAAHALTQLRDATAIRGVGDGISAASAYLLGPFEDLDSPAVEYFFVDVHTGQLVPEFEAPPSAIIPRLQDNILQLLTANSPVPTPTSTEDQYRGWDQQPQGTQLTSGSGAEADTVQQDTYAADESAREAEAEGGSLGGPSAGPGVPEPLDPGPNPAAIGPAADVVETAGAATVAMAPTAPGPVVDSDWPHEGFMGSSRPASASASGRSSRPQSAASSALHSGGAAAAAAATATAAAGGRSTAGSPSPSSHGRRTKPPSRECSGGSVGTGPGTASASGIPQDASVTAMEGPAARSSRPATAAAVAAPAVAAPAVAAAPATSSPPPSALVMPLAAATAAAGSPRSLVQGSYEYEDDDAVGYRRDGGTTAGYAGSVSVSGGGGGQSVSRHGSGGSSVRESGSGSAAGGCSGSGGAGEALGLSGSGRSDGTAGSGSGRSSGSGGRGNSSGGSGGVGIRPPIPPPSGRLTFYGWWFEDVESPDLTFRIDTNPTAGGGLAPRHCTLVYDFVSSSYSFIMRDPVTPPAPGQPYEGVPALTVPGICGDQVAMCDTGRPAELWDLHLGARLRVLGRQVLLKNSDLASAQWHASYFRQLSMLREKLHQEIQKYKPRQLRPGLVADKGDVRLQTGQQLRHVALQVRELIEDLRQYRPAKAESFMAALPIQF